MNFDFNAFFDDLPSRIELGMIMDVKEFFEGNEMVEEFSLDVRGDVLYVEIMTKGLKEHVIRRIMSDFFSFVGYDELKMLQRTVFPGTMKYAFYTANGKELACKMVVALYM